MNTFSQIPHVIADGGTIYISQSSTENETLCINNGGSQAGVFETTDVGLGMANLLFEPEIRGHIKGNVLDNGTGSSVQGLAMSLLTKGAIIFHDVNKNALQHAKIQVEENHVKNQCMYILGDKLFSQDEIPLISFGVSNLPQNREFDFCGTGGSELQIRETLKLGEVLDSQGKILTKSVSYADSIHNDSQLKEMYRIEKASKAKCINPNTQGNASVEYFLLEKK